MPTPAQLFVKGVAQHTVVWNVIKATTHNQLLRGQHEPHDFQLDAATSVALGKDTILIAPTGSRKTLILAMPLLYHEYKISIIISPLHALESDQVDRMNGMGIRSLLIDTAALPKSTFNLPFQPFHICFTVCLLQDIENGVYRLIKCIITKTFYAPFHSFGCRAEAEAREGAIGTGEVLRA